MTCLRTFAWLISVSWLIFCLSKDAVLRWEQTTSAVIQKCPDCPPPPPPSPPAHPPHHHRTGAGETGGNAASRKALELFSWHSSIHFLFFPHKAVIKSYNLIKVWHDSTASSDKICAQLVLFLSLFAGFCVKVSCFVCMSLHRYRTEVWMHAYIQTRMLHNMLLNRFAAQPGIST